eukprot:scaffold7159_cov63-Cyclotella_meneghiniana.AAC.4
MYWINVTAHGPRPLSVSGNRYVGSEGSKSKNCCCICERFEVAVLRLKSFSNSLKNWFTRVSTQDGVHGYRRSWGAGRTRSLIPTNHCAVPDPPKHLLWREN